jgi:hypothetical protein
LDPGWVQGDAQSYLDAEFERRRAELERYRALAQALGAESVRVGVYYAALRGWREL